MRSSKLSYLITRTHGLRTHLLSKEKMLELARSTSIKDFIEKLSDTDYSKDINLIPSTELTAARLEKLFRNMQIKRYLQLLKLSPKNIKSFISSYEKRIEVDVLKKVLRSLHTRTPKDKIERLIPEFPFGFTNINFKALIEAENVENAVKLLKETEYRELERLIPLYRKLSNIIPLELMINQIYFKHVKNTLNTVPTGRDEIEKIIEFEDTLKTIELITLIYDAKISADLLLKSGLDLRISLEEVHAIIEEGIEKLPDLFKEMTYRELAEKIVSDYSLKNMLKIKWRINKSFYKEAEHIAIISPLSVAYLVYYLIMCEREANNLISIATGVELGVKEVEIEKNIL